MKLTQLTKWDNLFWSQPTSSNNTSISAIENNMTKNLLYLLTNKHCKKIKAGFLKKINLKNSKIKRKKCQLTISDVNSYEDKPTYLIYLTKSKTKFIEGEDKNKDKNKNEKNIYDGYIEFDNFNLIFEVKVNSPNDDKQIEKYEKELNDTLGKKYKEKKDLYWDDIHDILMDSIKGKGIEKIFAEEYVNLMEVSGMVNKFYGFKGSTIAEHNHELKCLLNEIPEFKNNYTYDKTNKGLEAWISVYDINHKSNKNIHYTIWKDESNLEFYLTIHDDGLSKKFINSLLEEKFNDEINEIIKNQKDKQMQINNGRIFVIVFSDYRVLKPKSRKGGSFPNLRIIYRIDDLFTWKTNKSKKEKKIISIDKNYLSDIKKIKEVCGSKVGQVQIGFLWNLQYSKNRVNWNGKDVEKSTKYAIDQIQDAFKQLRPFYLNACKLADKKIK